MTERTYKLTYFNSRGGAELSRLVFKAAGVDFVDERLQGEAWTKRKPDMPLEALPVIQIDDDKVICQGSAIARYLAREFGLMGNSNLDGLRIEEIHEMFNEMVNKELIKMYHEKDLDKKKELVKTFAEESMKKYLNFVERRLKENSGGKKFFLGDKLTLGDLIIYDGITLLQIFLKESEVDAFNGRPLLAAHFKAVGDVPEIKEWVEKRPESLY